MKLSICITHYKEPAEVCKPLFDSIALQRGIDWGSVEVIVANDGKDGGLDTVPLPLYPFDIKFVSHDHKGVSATRNLAFDNATGDYVMFCDCDDMFLNNCGLHLVFSAMNENPDVIISSFVEELIDSEGNYSITRHDKDATFIHGKAFRRQFLLDEELRFKDELTIHEDGYFNLLAQVCTDNQKEITTPFYLWKWNSDSVVRTHMKDFTLETYDHLMRCREAICEELNKRGYVNEFINAVVKTVVDSYYDFNKSTWLLPENKPARERAERAFKKFYLRFGKEYKEANITRIAEIMYVCRQHAYANGLRVEQTTISDWLTHITRDV